MTKTRFALIPALLLVGTAPLIAQGAHRGTAAAARPAAASRYGAFGIDLAARDPAFKPGDDFWRYANNTWFAHNPIPADRTNWGVGSVLNDDVEAQLHAIVESAAVATGDRGRFVIALSGGSTPNADGPARTPVYRAGRQPAAGFPG